MRAIRMADENETNFPPATSKLKNFIGLIPVAIAFAVLTVSTWRKWPDLLIDFGAQLYVPWQLSLGKVLYRDVMYFAGGPLSQYFNALLFKVFGVSFTTLIAANLVIVALLLLLIYRFFLKISDQLTATIICLVIVLLFAFSQYLQVGNYNYIAPYAHETLHGLVISVVALTLLSRWLLRKSIASIAGAGICFGCVFLTKPDIFTALVVATMAAFFTGFYHQRSAHWLLKSVGCFLICSAIPLVITFLFFRSVENNGDAIRSVVWAWIPLLTTSAAKNEFYQSGLGFDDLVPNLILTVAQFLGYCFGIVLCAWASRPFSTRSRREQIFSILIFVGLIASAFFHKWFEGARALLPLTPVVCLTLIWVWRKSPQETNQLAPAILWSVFSLALLAKMGVHSRIWHYGFYLAMPATAAAIYFVFWFLPNTLQRWNVQPVIFRTILFCLLTIGATRLVALSTRIYGKKTFGVGHGADKILGWQPKVDPVSRDMEAALKWIEANCPANATLAAIPEGVMLNYLSRRANPTPYNFILPVFQERFGEDVILAAYQKTPPDYVALIQRDTSEFGFDYFGQTEAYGLKMMHWIKANYLPVHLIGHEPLQNGAFGIKIFKRNPADQTQ